MADETSRRYLFVAIDRATRWVFIRVFKAKTAANARRFLRDLERACPMRIRTILTDNGKEFTDRLFGLRKRAATGEHEFDTLCTELGIEHRLTPPKSPQTNGMVERFNGRIEEVLQSHHFRSGEDLEATLHRYVWLYNQQLPQSALGSKTPLQAMKDWHKLKPELFRKRPYYLPGCDTYTHLATPKRPSGDPLRLAFCWAHGRRKLIKAKPKKGSPIVDEALLRIAALYKVEDAIRGSDPDHRRAVRQEMSRPLVDEFFTWLKAQAARVSRKSDLGEAMAYMLKRQDGFRLFLDDGHVDIDSNLVENAIRSPAMKRRNALFAGHDEGGRNWARFASLIGTCKMNGVEPYAYLRDLFTKLANGHLDKDIDALMPWAYARQDKDT